MSKEKFDFSGWATKNNLRCSDGRTILKDAFIDDDGKTVPLVWMHRHDGPENVIGHALLENRKDGVYCYAKFNDTENGKLGKKLVASGDITSLSIYANGLKQQNGNVLHGAIREVSLVLAGANPGASIEFPILEHGIEAVEEAILYTDDDLDPREVELIHADPEEPVVEEEEVITHAEEGEKEVAEEKTVKDVFDSMTDEQKNVVYFMIGQALENGGAEAEEDETDEDVEHGDFYGGGYYADDMKHNVFDTDVMAQSGTLSDEEMATIFKDAKKEGTLSESVLAHAEDYGIDGVEWLFPEDRELNRTPEFIKRDQDWVSVVMNGVHHTPFSRVKSTFANITEDEARAKGYIKGKLKKEEVFSLLKRATTPQTIYKKQKMDRDDIIDITDFDVVSWLKGEMRMMLNEEIARAILIGDGRLSSDDDKISEDHIRPIANDADLFTIKVGVTAGSDDAATAKNLIRGAIKARKDYKGSGNPILFTTEDWLTEMLLLEDNMGRTLYESESALATKMRVSKIVTVPVLENAKVGTADLMGIIVNLKDYNVGADKGGAVSMFEDFDIDYNQEKYLIETRCSGALTVPYSAIILFKGTAPAAVDGGVIKSKTTDGE